MGSRALHRKGDVQAEAKEILLMESELDFKNAVVVSMGNQLVTISI